MREETRAEERGCLMLWVVWVPWGRKRAEREPGKSKVKRWSRAAAEKKVKSHSWAVLDHLWNFQNSPNPERTLQISSPLKAELHQSLWGSSPFQLVWHPRRWAHISSLAGPRSLLQPGHPLAGQAAIRTGSKDAQFLCIEIWPKSFSFMFSAHISPSPQPQAQCASTLIIHSPIFPSPLQVMLVPAFPVYTSTPPPALSSHSPFSLLPHLLYWPLKKKKKKTLTESTLYHQQMFSLYFMLEVWGTQRQKDMVSDLKELLDRGGQHS